MDKKTDGPVRNGGIWKVEEEGAVKSQGQKANEGGEEEIMIHSGIKERLK